MKKYRKKLNDDDNYLENCKKMFIELRDEINKNLDCIQKEQNKIQAKREEGETVKVNHISLGNVLDQLEEKRARSSR